MTEHWANLLPAGNLDALFREELQFSPTFQLYASANNRDSFHLRGELYNLVFVDYAVTGTLINMEEKPVSSKRNMTS